MEQLLYDLKASDVAVAWRAAHCAGSTTKLAKLSRKRLEVSYNTLYSFFLLRDVNLKVI